MVGVVAVVGGGGGVGYGVIGGGVGGSVAVVVGGVDRGEVAVCVVIVIFWG